MRRAAHQHTGSCPRRIRWNRSRKPPFPSAILVRMMPATLGPRSMAGNIRMPVIFGKRSWRIWYGAATARAPIQEIVNVSAKYATTRCRPIQSPIGWESCTVATSRAPICMEATCERMGASSDDLPTHRAELRNVQPAEVPARSYSDPIWQVRPTQTDIVLPWLRRLDCLRT